MMRRFLVSISALAILAGACPSAIAATPLIGKMAMFNYLAGGRWSCTVKVALPGQSSSKTVHDSSTYEVISGNIIHQHVTSPDEDGDDYYGYDAKDGLYWHSGLDSSGVFSWATSPDGKTFVGSSWSRDSTDGKIRVVTTYTQVNPNHQEGHLTVFTPHGQALVTGNCTR